MLRGPLAFAAYNPEAALALFDLHNAAVAGSLSPRVRELAILVEFFRRKGAMDMVAVMVTYAASGFYAIAVDEHMPAGRPDLTPLN